MQEVDLLAKLYLFNQVPRQDLEMLTLMCEPRRVAPREVLLKQGDPADRAMLVVAGRLVANVDTGAGIETVGDIRPGEIVGETALFLDGAIRSATVTATEPSLCLAVGHEVFERAPQNKAVVALEKHMLGTLARRIRGVNQLVQRVWKTTPTVANEEPAAEESGGLISRLRSMFGGDR